MQTAEQLSALSSKDGQQWWGLTGCVGSLPLDTPHPDVRRLVLGDLSSDAAVEVSKTLRSLLQNLQAAFPRLTHLHLWNVRQLTELGGLPASLQCLDLRGCRELLKIDPLPDSARLQSLDLADCAQLTALPKADYSSLTRVWLHGCLRLLSFQPLLAAVPSLKHLELYDCRFQDLDASLCGVPGENVADKVRQHFQALQDQKKVPFAECKLIVLGDGGVGKTSLVRAILGERHDPDEPITHGIGLWRWNGAAPGQQPPVLFPERSDAQLTLNIWDFGGQDLYHNTHRLFMETQAVFIVVERWKDPKKPRRPQNPTDIDRPLQYWLEQVTAATAGSQHKPRVLIVRTAIDDQTQKPFALDPWQERVKTKFHEHSYFELSCLDNQRDTEAWKTFRSTLLEQIRETLGGAESKSILQPRGRVAVRQKLRAGHPACNEPRTSDHTAAPMLLLHQFHDLVRQTFQEHGLPEPNKAELDGQLDFFHQRGVIYAPPSWLKRHSTPSAFPVIVDQLWLIEGIYQFISTQSLRDDWIVQLGKVTREDLDSAWDQLQTLKPDLRLDPQARWAMLACMENFGLLVSTQADEEWSGILPEFLPKRQTVLEGQAQRNDTVIGEWKVQQKRCYRLQDTALGMGIGCQLIGWLVSTFGQTYRLYKFGALVTLQVYSSESAESRQVRVELRWEKESEDDFAGDLWLWLPADCGVEAEVLCYLEEQLQRRQLVRKGTQFARQPSRDPSARAQPTPYIHLETQHLPKRGGRLPGQDIGTTVRPVYTLGRVGISWAGGATDSEQEFWPLLIDQMLRERSEGKFDVVQYKKTEDCKQTTHEMLQNLAEADLLIAVISNKYLNSAYCMVELLQAARKWSTDNDQGAPIDNSFPADISQWLRRIWFVVLSDAKWILDSDEGAVASWAAKCRLDGLTHCYEYAKHSANDEAARQHSAETDVRDPWMRFAAADVNNPKRFRAVLKSDAPRTTVSMELATDPQLRDTKGRAGLESFIDKVIPAIFDRIDGMQPKQKIERCIKIAKRHHAHGKHPDAWAWVEHCLQQFQNPQEMSQKLHDDATVPPELSELKPLLPAWRDHIGVTRPPASS